MPKMQNSSAAVVVDTTNSAYAMMRPVSLDAVKFTDRFWAPRLKLNREVTLPLQYQQLEESGRLDNFRRAAGKTELPFQGRVYDDSDVYKWLEAAAWTLAGEEDADLAQMVEEVISLIVAAQDSDGYLNTYYTFERATERWSNLKDKHELYCAGHLILAAIAHHRGSADRRLLHVARRFADLIVTVFGAGVEQQSGVPGHPGLEMALIELARLTGEVRYREGARYFLESRGQGLIGGRVYHGDQCSFYDLPALAGHAVRALYLCAGAADLYAEEGDSLVQATLLRLWEHMVARQMYVSGGLGARHKGEAWGDDYELPNARAYAETCAAIASVMWNWRMLQNTGDVRYADVLELALYNAMLPGVSLDGRAYFYDNPLSSDGEQRRKAWFACVCCPTNSVRLLASLPGYVYSVSDDTVWVHLYVAGEAKFRLPDGREVHLIQRTRYPWDGHITVEVLSEGPFTLRLRIPSWCGGQDFSTHAKPRRHCCSVATDAAGCEILSVNGDPDYQKVTPGTYVEVRRDWVPGDAVCLHMPMPVRMLEAHPHVLENRGRVALMRGPLLYCLEAVDHPGVDLRDVVLAPNTVFEHRFRRELLGGVEILTAQGQLAPPDDGWCKKLYRIVQKPAVPCGAVDLHAVPYYAWANRDAGQMQVWLRRHF